MYLLFIVINRMKFNKILFNNNLLHICNINQIVNFHMLFNKNKLTLFIQLTYLFTEMSLYIQLITNPYFVVIRFYQIEIFV